MGVHHPQERIDGKHENGTLAVPLIRVHLFASDVVAAAKNGLDLLLWDSVPGQITIEKLFELSQDIVVLIDIVQTNAAVRNCVLAKTIQLRSSNEDFVHRSYPILRRRPRRDSVRKSEARMGRSL